MPAYFRTPLGDQATWTISELAEVLSVRVDAGLIRAAYSDTWTPEGSGLPMPMEISLTVPIAAASASAVAGQLYNLSQQGIAAIGYESPLQDDGYLEWERPVLAVRRLEVREGGPRHAFVRMSFYVAPTIYRLTRAATSEGDTLVDSTGAVIVFAEEV